MAPTENYMKSHKHYLVWKNPNNRMVPINKAMTRVSKLIKMVLASKSLRLASYTNIRHQTFGMIGKIVVKSKDNCEEAMVVQD